MNRRNECEQAKKITINPTPISPRTITNIGRRLDYIPNKQKIIKSKHGENQAKPFSLRKKRREKDESLSLT